MPQRMEAYDPALHLTAFADGETDPAQSAEIVEYLSAHPDAARGVASAMRLRAATKRAIEYTTPPASEALRRKIAALMAREAPAQTARRISRWRLTHRVIALAVAALLFIALGLGFDRMLLMRRTASSPIPVTLVSELTRVHVDCSRAPSLHHQPLTHQLGELEDSLKKYLGRPTPYPDLSSIGYEYVGAGPCPLEGAAHLLYKSIRPPVTDTVSLFVQKYAGQISIEEGKLYWAQGRDAAHPMLVWRRGGLVFYLVGNAEQPLIDAAGVMHLQVPA